MYLMRKRFIRFTSNIVVLAKTYKLFAKTNDKGKSCL